MEWTKEQREQAADQLNRIGWSPEYWDSYHPERREREIASVVTGSGVLIPAHKLVDTFCKLTAALDENERLVNALNSMCGCDTQMGELAVGGRKWNVESLLGALMSIRDDFEMDYVVDGVIVDDPPNSYGRAYRLAKSALENALPAPPSGEQAAVNVGMETER